MLFSTVLLLGIYFLEMSKSCGIPKYLDFKILLSVIFNFVYFLFLLFNVFKKYYYQNILRNSSWKRNKMWTNLVEWLYICFDISLYMIFVRLLFGNLSFNFRKNIVECYNCHGSIIRIASHYAVLKSGK